VLKNFKPDEILSERGCKRKRDSTSPEPNPEGFNEPGKTQHCQFHTGSLSKKVWSCCKQRVTADKSLNPCSGRPLHASIRYKPEELKNLWQHYITPASSAASTQVCCVRRY